MSNPEYAPKRRTRGSLLFFILSCGIIIGFSADEPRLNDLQKNRIKGNVKFMVETRTGVLESDTNHPVEDITYKKISKFNDEGFETEVSIYKGNGENSTIFFQFDTAGNQTGYKEFSGDGTLWLSVHYLLDEKGFRKEASYNWQEKRGYDEIREKSEQLYEVLARDPYDRVLYKNDYRGFPLEEKYLKANGTLLFKFTYRYDILGNKVEMVYFNSAGKTSWETKYKYDRNNNLIGSTIYKSNRIAARSKFRYQFDSKGNWVNRTEEREVNLNILTACLKSGTFLIQREIEYYP